MGVGVNLLKKKDMGYRVGKHPAILPHGGVV